MSNHTIAAKTKDEQDKVNFDLAASSVAYKERLHHYRKGASHCLRPVISDT